MADEQAIDWLSADPQTSSWGIPDPSAPVENQDTQQNNEYDWTGADLETASWGKPAVPQEPNDDITLGDVGTTVMKGFTQVGGGLAGTVEWAADRAGLNSVRDFAAEARRGFSKAGKDWDKGMNFWSDHPVVGGLSEGGRVAASKKWATTGKDAAWKDAGSWVLGISQSVPYLLTSVVPGSVVAKLGGSAKAIALTAGATNAVQEAGVVQTQLADEIEGYTTDQLKQMDGVQEALDRGMSEKQVRQLLISEATKYAVPAAGGVGFATGYFGGPIEAAILTKMPKTAATKTAAGYAARASRPVSAALGAGTEAAQEALESTAETVAPNLAMGRPATEGLAENVVQGVAVGAGTGGGMGLASPASHPVTAPPPKSETTPPPAEGTPSPTGRQPQEDQPTPEPAAYVERQLKLLDAGTRQAVLVTPGTDVTAVDTTNYNVTQVAPDGTALITKPGDEQTIKRVKDAYATGDNATIQSTLGDVLGYGMSQKAVGAEDALTIRDAEGNVVQDVLYDNSQSAIDAANRHVAALGDGASVEIRPAHDSILERETNYYNEQNAPVVPKTPSTKPETPETPEAVSPAGASEAVTPSPVPENRPTPTPPPVEGAVQVPPSPLSLQSVPNDENPAMQTIADEYTQSINRQADIPHGQKVRRLAEEADHMIDALVAFYEDLKGEGYNLTGLQKIFTPVLGRISMSKVRSGNRPLVADRIKKKLGSSLTKEMEQTIAAGQELGPGRKSGQYSGDVTIKQFGKFFNNVKEFIDKANIERQAKRAIPATEKARAAKNKSKERTAAETKPVKEGKAAQPEMEIPEPKEKPVEKESKPKKEKETEKPAAEKKPTQAKSKPKQSAEDKKLAAMMIDVPVMVEETGEKTTMRERADKALAYESKRIDQLKQLVGCLMS